MNALIVPEHSVKTQLPVTHTHNILFMIHIHQVYFKLSQSHSDFSVADLFQLNSASNFIQNTKTIMSSDSENISFKIFIKHKYVHDQ